MASTKRLPTLQLLIGLVMSTTAAAGPAESSSASLDNSLLLLDLQYEVITKSEHDPWVNACIADQLSSQWLLSPKTGVPVPEIIQDRVTNASTKCHTWVRQQAPRSQGAEGTIREVGAAVSVVLNENAKARIRLAEKRNAVRGCMSSSKDDADLETCLNHSNIGPISAEVISKFKSLFALWGK